MIKGRIGWILSWLSVSVFSCQSAGACPCSVVSVPDTDPGYNNIDGLKFSHTPEYRREFEEGIASARRYCKAHLDVAHRAIVSDIDETLFDNREFDANCLKFDHVKWIQWVREERVPC